MEEELRETPQNENENTQTNEKEGDISNPELDKEQDKDNPVQLTQKQLDELINRTFAKGIRSGKRQARQSVEKQPESSHEENDMEQKAESILKKANERLLAGTIKSLALDIGITAKGAKVAAKLADFSDCIKNDGEVDEDSIKDILEDFAKEYPELKKEKDDKPDQFAWGMRQGSQQRMSGVEAAFFKNNPDLK